MMVMMNVADWQFSPPIDSLQFISHTTFPHLLHLARDFRIAAPLSPSR